MEYTCQFCGNLMTGNSCSSTIIFDGIKYPRIKFGDAKIFDDSIYDQCPDCGCSIGQYHHYYCAQEECPLCVGQLLTCIAIKEHGIVQTDTGELLEIDYEDETNEFTEEFEDIRDEVYDNYTGEDE